jgi:biopolymer transport protein ExbB/TolQ
LEKVAWVGIISAGWPVLSILFIGSIVTFAVIYERWKIFSKIKLDSNTLLDSIRTTPDRHKILNWCEKSDQPLAVITKTIYKSDSREEKERLLQRCIQSLVQKLESRLSVLGTIASVAPFIGLLGTVIGIIKSFQAVSATSAGGASLVALGIAEALVGTAAGLIVAIPALLGYNFFVNKLRVLTADWELVGAEIIDFSLKERGQL